MTENKKRIIPIDGRDVEYVEVYDMTLDEIASVMSATGCTAVEAEQALRLGNPLVWKAVLTVAVKRTRPGANVDAALGRLKLGDIVELIFPDAEEEVEEDDPPAVAAVEPPPSSVSESGPVEIRAISGSQ